MPSDFDIMPRHDREALRAFWESWYNAPGPLDRARVIGTRLLPLLLFAVVLMALALALKS
jgi:hypothetical protein